MGDMTTVGDPGTIAGFAATLIGGVLGGLKIHQRLSDIESRLQGLCLELARLQEKQEVYARETERTIRDLNEELEDLKDTARGSRPGVLSPMDRVSDEFRIMHQKVESMVDAVQSMRAMLPRPAPKRKT